MPDYSFAISKMRFSHSRANTYRTCPLSFKYGYIIKEENKLDNFYGQYGNLVHKVMEKYLKSELEIFELESYFEDNFDKVAYLNVPFPKGIRQRYFEAGKNFFRNLEFDKTKFEVKEIESEIELSYEGVDWIVKPDLVVMDKESGIYYLYDYKSSKYSKEKAEEYLQQMYLYVHFINMVRDYKIEKIKIWFIREDKVFEETVDWAKEEEVVRGFYDTIETLTLDQEFKPKPDAFFCNIICSWRSICPFVPPTGKN